MRQPKPRPCKQCKQVYQPQRSFQAVCSIKCAIDQSHEKQRQAAAKKAREKHLSDKERLKPRRKWLEEAQRAFNSFIRARDKAAGLPCVSCGRHHEGQYHAGHYRPVGGQGSALRFNEVNCWLQCSVCNNHKSGNLTPYREELVKRIGLPLVEWLEQDHPPAKWTIDELKWLKQYYKDALKQVKSYQ